MVASALLVALLGCTSSGEDSGGSGNPPSQAFTIGFADGNPGAVGPGTVVLLVASGAPQDGVYAGALGDTSLPLVVLPDGRLGLLVPPVPPGAHQLRVTRGTAAAELLLSVAPYEPIVNPVVYLGDTATTLEAALAAAELAETDPADRALIAGWRADLSEAAARLDSLSSHEQALLAYALRSVEQATEPVPSVGAMQTVGGCKHSVPFTTAFGKMAAAGALVAVSIGAGPFGLATGAFGAAVFGYYAKEVWRLGAAILDDCVGPQDVSLDAEASVGIRSAAVLGLEHDVAKTFPVTTTWALTYEARDLLRKGAGFFQQFAEILPAGWGGLFSSYAEITTRPGGPAGLELGAVNANPNVLGELTLSGTSVTLKFRFSDKVRQVGEPLAFTFELRSNEYAGRVWRKDATLAPRCLETWLHCPEVGCVEAQVDNYNCGACGNVCTGGTRCSGGTCVSL